jgi:hypothetical protein
LSVFLLSEPRKEKRKEEVVIVTAAIALSPLFSSEV